MTAYSKKKEKKHLVRKKQHLVQKKEKKHLVRKKEKKTPSELASIHTPAIKKVYIHM
jgi:hypothetical protein